MKHYNREVIISKLLTKGFKPKPNIKKINSFFVHNKIHIGIKILGMLDFLKIPIERPKPYVKSLTDHTKKKSKAPAKIIGECFLCRKEVSNHNGLFRLYFNNRLIKLHKGTCEHKHNLIMNKN